MVIQPVHGGWDSDPGSETSLSALYGGAWPASPSAYVQPTGNASPRRLVSGVSSPHAPDACFP